MATDADKVKRYFIDTMFFPDTDLTESEVAEIRAAALRGVDVPALPTTPGLQRALEIVTQEFNGLGPAIEDGSDRAVIQAAVFYMCRRMQRLIRKEIKRA